MNDWTILFYVKESYEHFDEIPCQSFPTPAVGDTITFKSSSYKVIDREFKFGDNEIHIGLVKE